MRTFYVLAFFFAFFQLTGIAFAHPPPKMDLSYDLKTQNIHIDVSHTTKAQLNHYIRKVIIYKNDVIVKEFVYAKQTTATKLIQDFYIEAVDGDTISVKAISSQGGDKTEELLISKPTDEQK